LAHVAAGRVLGVKDSTSETDSYIGQVLAGRYRIVSLLGSGGMGSVYRAEHVHMQKSVAVKILHRHMTTNREVVARFEQEAVAAGRIEHPNVTAALDFGKLDDGSFYLALEYVEGKNLGDVLDLGAMAPERALWIARQIADGLAAAHAAGIVHRDLKPDNVLLVDRDGVTDLVKMLDFGIAKLHLAEGSGNRPLTQIGTIFGTPQYMSPEQGQGRTVDGRSDLYALGVILYEMLAGKLPFDADDLIVLITRHVTEPPPPLPEAVPAPVRALVAELLEKKPEARVQTAALLVARIDELSGRPPAPSRGQSSARGFAPAALSDTERPLAASPDSSFPSLRERAPRLARAVVAWASRAHRALVRRFPALDRVVTLGGHRLPLVGVALGGFSLALVGALVTLLVVPARPSELGGAGSETAAKGAAARPARETEAARQQKLVERALVGDEAALAALDAIPPKQRRLEDARALGRGRCALGQWPACIGAHKAALLAFPTLRKDTAVLADVRRAAEAPSASEDALRLAAHNLGERGLDIVWDVWSATRQKQDQAALSKRARQFLDDSAVQRQASRELSLVLELERAERRRRCGEAKSALAKVREYGDRRVLPTLERFKSTRGCGFMDLGDCWGCLRGKQELASARDSAAARPGPSFAGE
jgi:eukaryotic-like serine/threonine-protein kinase